MAFDILSVVRSEMRHCTLKITSRPITAPLVVSDAHVTSRLGGDGPRSQPRRWSRPTANSATKVRDKSMSSDYKPCPFGPCHIDPFAMATRGSTRGPRASTPRRPTAGSSRGKSASNTSILTFFKKVEVVEEESLFVGPTSSQKPEKIEDGDIVYKVDNENDTLAEDLWLDEADNPVKKRRRPEKERADGEAIPEVMRQKEKPKPLRKGPFLDESDSEDESEPATETTPAAGCGRENWLDTGDVGGDDVTLLSDGPSIDTGQGLETPSLEKQDSLDAEFGDVGDIDDLFDDGGDQEYREMRYSQEQARLEAEEQGSSVGGQTSYVRMDDPMTNCCPICYGSLEGVTEAEATAHVNGCLDGTPVPLPSTKPKEQPTAERKQDDGRAPVLTGRAAKAAVPRPGQSNPFDIGQTSTATTSAFAKLMAGHAEDAAWAAAAAAEESARGKAAYQRTCPFYKIMPGFSICVDAFRYGAVQGCNAYFLSHFHSDHYVGLTSSWSHGPIFCSKVTADLARLHLRVADKYLVELPFDERTEVPEADGVYVTMIPANHCPGSSLFLFEKSMGKGPNARVQRILHCGDFRACPAHVRHPALRHQVLDTVSQTVRQQKIDVCYLDTTYLNPRYSFPPQEDVIRACADFCASLSPDPNNTDDILEQAKRERGATTMKQFLAAAAGPTDGAGDAEDDAAPLTDAALLSDAPGVPADKSIIPPPPPPIPHPLSCPPPPRLLVICGTYSIGKERICKAIAQALGSRIYAGPAKTRTVSLLGDPELVSLLTSDPRAAQVHMQPLAELRAETLREYLNAYRPHFSRIVGLRPTGWNFRPSMAAWPSSSSGGGSAFGGAGSGPGGAGGGGGMSAASTATTNLQPTALPTVQLLHGHGGWRIGSFSAHDLARHPQRGSTKDAICIGVPYSEHSSFRELALFLMSLNIERVVPTVNVGNANARRRMKAWTDRWIAERRRAGVVTVLEKKDAPVGVDGEGNGVRMWDGKDARGGAVYW